jgi:hypothetical protein
MIPYIMFLFLLEYTCTICSMENMTELGHQNSPPIENLITIQDMHGTRQATPKDVVKKFRTLQACINNTGTSGELNLPTGLTVAGFDLACQYVQKTEKEAHTFFDTLITQKIQPRHGLQERLKDFMSRVIAMCFFWRKTVARTPALELDNFLKIVYTAEALEADFMPVASYLKKLVEENKIYKAALILKALNQDDRGKHVMHSIDNLNAGFSEGKRIPWFSKHYKHLHRTYLHTPYNLDGEGCTRNSLSEHGIFIKKQDKNFAVIYQTETHDRKHLITRELIDPLQLLSTQAEALPQSLWSKILHWVLRRVKKSPCQDTTKTSTFLYDNAHEAVATNADGSIIFIHDFKNGTLYYHDFDQKQTKIIVENNSLLQSTPGPCIYNETTQQLLMPIKYCVYCATENHRSIVINCKESTKEIIEIPCGTSRDFFCNNRIHAIGFNNRNAVVQSSRCTQQNIPFYPYIQPKKWDGFLSTTVNSWKVDLDISNGFGFITSIDIKTLALHTHLPIAILGYNSNPFGDGKRNNKACALTLWDLDNGQSIGSIHPKNTTSDHYDCQPVISDNQVSFLRQNRRGHEPLTVISYTLSHNQGNYNLQNETRYMPSLDQAKRGLDNYALGICSTTLFFAMVVARPAQSQFTLSGDYPNKKRSSASLDIFYQPSYCETIYLKALEAAGKDVPSDAQETLHVDSFGRIPHTVLQRLYSSQSYPKNNRTRRR